MIESEKIPVVILCGGMGTRLKRILINFLFKNLRNSICFLAHFFCFFIYHKNMKALISFYKGIKDGLLHVMRGD